MKTAADFPSRLTGRIQAAGLRLTPGKEDLGRLERYYQALAKWNRRINLTSLVLDGFPARSLDRLFIESFVAAEHIEDSPAVWLDLGSGGGSPAIPLKIVRPRLALTMVESKAKKAAFLREAAHAVGLADVDVLATRIEAIGHRIEPGSVDLATVRAVRLDPSILSLIEGLLRPSARLFLFGLRVASEPSPSRPRVASEPSSSSARVDSEQCQSQFQAVSELNLRGFHEVLRQDLPAGSGCLIVLAKM